MPRGIPRPYRHSCAVCAVSGRHRHDRARSHLRPKTSGGTIETELFIGAYGENENSRAQADAAISFRTRQGANGTDDSIGVDIFGLEIAGKPRLRHRSTTAQSVIIAEVSGAS